ENFLLLAASRDHESALRIASLSSDNIDNSVDGVLSPRNGARSADDLDAIDVAEHDVLHVPKDTREERAVYAAAVDQDKKFGSSIGIESARSHEPIARARAYDGQAGHETEDFGNISCS